MSLAITAGSLPTLRPLYRIIATKLSWKISFFSATRKSYNNSYRFIDVTGNRVWLNKPSDNGNRQKPDFRNCSESERDIVSAKNMEIVLEDRRPEVPSKFMRITKVTDVQVDYEDERTVKHSMLYTEV